MGQFCPVRPILAKPKRNGLGLGTRFAQAAFGTAPIESSRGLPPFELRWRAASLSPAPLRVGAAITMAPAASRPCDGGSRDILWRVSTARTVACARPRRGRVERASVGRACALVQRGERVGRGQSEGLITVWWGGLLSGSWLHGGRGVLGKAGYGVFACGMS